MTQAPAHIAADVLVIGAGGAGMYASLAAAEAGAGRIVLADRNMVGRGGATVMAQMTVAAALGEAEPDSVDDHLEDTLEAGRGLCDPALARLLCEEGPTRIREMDAWKVGWAREGGAHRSGHRPRPPAPALLLRGHPQHRPRRRRHAPPPHRAGGRDQARLRPRRDRPGDG